MLASVKGTLFSVLYRRRSNSEEDESKFNSVRELEAISTVIEVKSKPIIVETGKMTKKEKDKNVSIGTKVRGVASPRMIYSLK